jgi:hypothetical protein
MGDTLGEAESTGDAHRRLYEDANAVGRDGTNETPRRGGGNGMATGVDVRLVSNVASVARDDESDAGTVVALAPTGAKPSDRRRIDQGTCTR